MKMNLHNQRQHFERSKMKDFLSIKFRKHHLNSKNGEA